MVDKLILKGLKDLREMVKNMDKPTTEFAKNYRVGLKDGINACIVMTEKLMKTAGKKID